MKPPDPRENKPVTIRDHYAAAAMNALIIAGWFGGSRINVQRLVSPDGVVWPDAREEARNLAAFAAAIADAMLDEALT